MALVDLVTAGPTAASPSLSPSGGASIGPIDFAQALVDAQAADTSEVGGVLGDAVPAVPEEEAVREARGDARFAVWLAMGRVAAQATSSAAIPSLGDATPPATARRSEVGGATVAAEAATSPADHDLEADMPASFALPVPGHRDWSMPVPSPGLPQASNQDPTFQSESTRAPIVKELSQAEPLATFVEPPGSDGAPRVTHADSMPRAAAPQAAPGVTEASLPYDLDQSRIDLPRGRGVPAAQPDEQPSRATVSEPHATVLPVRQPAPIPVSQPAPIDVGASETSPAETASREDRTPAAAPPQPDAKASPTARAETRASMPMATSVFRAESRAIDPSTVTRSTSAPRPVSEESQDPAGALAAKRPRQAYGPMTGAWLPAQAGTSVAVVTSPPHVAAPTAVASLEAPDADDLRSQIVQAMRVQWSGASGDARIRLQPHYLGELTISLRVEQGVVSAQLTASSPEVRQWIEANEALLRQGLAQHELKLERLVVAKDEPAPSSQHERESEPRGYQPPKRRARRSDTDATFEVVV